MTKTNRVRKEKDYSKCDERVLERTKSPYFPHQSTSTVVCFFFPKVRNTHIFNALKGDALSEEKMERVLEAFDYVIEARKKVELQEVASLEAKAKAIKEAVQTKSMEVVC